MTVQHPPALHGGLAFLIVAVPLLAVGEVGAVIGLVCLAAAGGCIAAAYTKI